MTATINASTTAGVVITPDNSGNVLLQYNGQSAPTFSAYNGSSQSLGFGFSQILFPTEEFDTNNNFASSRFTPTVAGYYLLSSAVRTNGAPGNEFSIFLNKSGSTSYKMGTTANQTGGILASTISIVAYANGTTDYFEIWMYCGASCTAAGGQTYTWFTGCLLRGA
jgi:hypothetical protein